MSDESRPEAPAGAPKRKGKVARKHTVGRVILVSALVLALITGLGTIYFVRHLNGNIDGCLPRRDRWRTARKLYKGNGQPLNILVMGSDTREGAGNEIDGEGGGGSDTTILVHLSADRDRAYAISIPRDSIVDRPEVGCDAPAESDVMWNAAYTVGGPVCTVAQLQATPTPRRPLRRDRLQRVRRHGRRRRWCAGLRSRGHRRPSLATSSCPPATRRC